MCPSFLGNLQPKLGQVFFFFFFLFCRSLGYSYTSNVAPFQPTAPTLFRNVNFDTLFLVIGLNRLIYVLDEFGLASHLYE